MRDRFIWATAWVGLVGCSSHPSGSASINASGQGPLRVQSAHYAQAQLTGRTQDANGKLAQGTVVGLFFFSQPNACADLAGFSADANGLLLSGPSTVFPWVELVGLASGVGTLVPGTYLYQNGGVNADLPALPIDGLAGSASGTLFADASTQTTGQQGSTLKLTRIDANLEGGRVEGNFLLSFGTGGSFSATYCANLGPLIDLIDSG
jgi:hypothetical protein